jgi:opacity protein-like surface antigen
MKNQIFFFALLFLLKMSPVFSQEVVDEKAPKAAITLGVLQGGGSLVGADFELLAGKRIGLQLGAGITGFGAGLNYHMKPSIKSSMISVQYWHQGIGDSYTQSLIGPNYVYRAKKLFTAQLGFGFALEEGPNWPEDKDQPPVMLMYAIGIYLPIK